MVQSARPVYCYDTPRTSSQPNTFQPSLKTEPSTPKSTVCLNFGIRPLILNHAATLVTLSLWDTAGQEDYERLRPLSYPQTDIFLVCFSVTSPVSFDNIVHKWLPELQEYSKSAKILLVGTKCDARTNSDLLKELAAQAVTPVTVESAQALAKKINAVGYVETSALTGHNIKECFETAVRAVLKKPSSECCSLM